jgi:capsular polysaccharide biosynthesis protein
LELIVFWKTIRRWWLIILIPTAIAFVWSLPALSDAIFPPETYGAEMRFTAVAPPDVENAIAAEEGDNRSGTYEDTSYIPWLASEYVVVNLPSWVTSSSFANAVSEELAMQGIDIDGDDLRAAFVADSARSILTVYLGWDDEEELKAIAQATVTVLQERNQEYFPQFNLEPAQIVPLDQVEVNQTTPPLTSRLLPLVRTGLGLVVGLGLAFLANYLDDSIRETDDLEKLELTVLGSIPDERR